jgi:hypothetical protein
LANLRHEEEETMVRAAAEQLDESAPRISGDTRFDELSVCTQSIFKSKAGAVPEGVILKSSDPRVLLLRRDREREGLRVCRAAWLVGVSVREYRQINSGVHWPDVETWDRICKLYGWPQTFATR